MAKKIKIGQSLNWVNKVLVDIIRRELEKGKTEQEVKDWLASLGFKPIDFKNEFKFLEPQINEMAQKKELSQKKTEETKKIKIKKLKLKPILIALSLVIVIVFFFQYSKEIKNLGSRSLGFIKNNTYDRIFKKDEIKLTSQENTKSPAVPSPENPPENPEEEIKTEISNEEQIIPVETSSIPVTIAGTSTDSEATAETAPSTTIDKETSPVSTTTDDNTEFALAISQSKNLWNSGKYNESLISAQTALEKAGNDQEKSKARYWIGISYYSQGKKMEAEQEELSAISLDPNYDPPYVTLAAINLDKNNCNQALDYSQKALQLNQNNFWNLNNLGLAYLCIGDKASAITYLQKAASLAPYSSVIKNNLELAIQIIY